MMDELFEFLLELIFEPIIGKLDYLIGSRIGNKALRIIAYVLVFVLMIVTIFGFVMMIALIERKLF